MKTKNTGIYEAMIQSQSTTLNSAKGRRLSTGGLAVPIYVT
ncbi:hypothetical protein [Sphingomonas agri]